MREAEITASDALVHELYNEIELQNALIKKLQKRLELLCDIAGDIRADGQTQCPMRPWKPYIGYNGVECIQDCQKCFYNYIEKLVP